MAYLILGDCGPALPYHVVVKESLGCDRRELFMELCRKARVSPLTVAHIQYESDPAVADALGWDWRMRQCKKHWGEFKGKS